MYVPQMKPHRRRLETLHPNITAVGRYSVVQIDTYIQEPSEIYLKKDKTSDLRQT